MKTDHKKKTWNIVIICINLLLAASIGAVFYFYTVSYHQKLHDGNINDISNINKSTAAVSHSFYYNQKTKLADIVQYINIHESTVQDALTFIGESNSDVNANFELIGTNNKGYVAIKENNAFIPVSYSSNDYDSLKKIFAETDDQDTSFHYTQEFTDQYTAAKCFGLYQHIILENQHYTLMGVYKSKAFADLMDIEVGFDGCSNVLVSSNGDYIFGSSTYKSDNLFRYFYVYNELNLDQENTDLKTLQENNAAVYYYKDSIGQDCVYILSPVEGISWYAVTSVPIASFHNPSFDLSYNIVMMVLLLTLMAVDLFYMDRANQRLRISISRETEANQAKTDFLSRMSHDIRTPLNVINGSVLLAKEQTNSDTTNKYLNNIDQSSKFLFSLVNDILDLNKVEQGKMELHPESYSLQDLDHRLTAIIEPLCQAKGIHFEITGYDDKELYYLDPVRTNQIFFNILSNSVKFTPAGGHIGLQCTSADTADGRKQLNFRVYDDGEGMSEEFQKHMFEAFSQEESKAKCNTQGTGLGLAIVHNLVKLMHGTLRVESHINQGTVFYITLVVDKSSPTKQEKEKAASIDLLQGKHALLCEDNPINAEIAKTMLEEKGMVITVAANGKEGVDTFANSAEGQFQVILMDMKMPVLDGIEATKQIRHLSRKDSLTIPILAMTANAYDTDVEACMQAGMNGHISKPIDPAVMYQTIAKQFQK